MRRLGHERTVPGWCVGSREQSTDRALVASIHDLSRVFGMKTVAEFVDSPELIEPLREIGIDYAQGFAVGKPVSIRAR